MAMELPVIATNWSGQSDFMGSEWSYPIKVEKLVPIEDQPEFGNRAEPSIDELRRAMREVVDYPQRAKAKGVRARQHVVDNFSNEKVAELILGRLDEIESKIDS